MTVTSHSIAPAIAFALLLPSCASGGSVGEMCESAGDCAADLQCLGGVCAPRCEDHEDCGDGFVCDEAGACQEVQSAIGDPCVRELDCGPGQACMLAEQDENGDGLLSASCQPSSSGSVTGSACSLDEECRSGTCALGRCTQLCREDGDCPGSLACTRLPRLLSQSAPLFSGCLQPEGVFSLSIPITSPFGRIRIPVPDSARSFALVSRVGDPTQLVGATRLTGPDDGVLFSEPSTAEEFYQNPIRYRKSAGISTLLVPNTTEVGLSAGVYATDVGSFLPEGGSGTEIPLLEVLYKLDDAAVLDLHFHFLELEDHPCAGAIDVADLEEGSAPLSPDFQDEYLGTLRSILEGAGLSVGEITYRDLTSRPDVDGLRQRDLGSLLEESTHATGVEIFFVRSISPEGIQALSPATPGAPRTPGSAASGIAVSVETLCYRDWPTVARGTAHALASHLGLFRNREPDGHPDPIPDSGTSEDNLMYFGEFGGAELSPGQRQVLRLSPALRRENASPAAESATAYEPLEAPPGDPALVEILSGIDFVPERAILDATLGAQAADDLAALAEDAGADAGLRIRAYRGLAHYPTQAVESALRTAVEGHGAPDGEVDSLEEGLDTVLLRAAMRSLAEVAGADAVSDLTPLLSHPARDVRAAAAFSLAATGSPGAVPLLRERLNVEQEPQVKLALSAAIRELDGT